MDILKRPVDVGVIIPTPIVMPPMASEGSEDGTVGPESIEF